MGLTSDAEQPRSARGELTIADVARLAGVSVPTVSKVVNGRSAVAAETRARVEKVMKEHGYRRSRRATTLVGALEVVFHELAGIYPVEIIKGIQRVAEEEQLGVLVSESQGRQTPNRGWIEGVLARAPLGVIAVYSDLSAEQRSQLSAREIPLLALDPTGVPGDDVPSVGATNWSGGLSATRHLLDLGHRRIAAITGPSWAMSSRARLDGYRTALETAGIPVDPTLVRQGSYELSDGARHAADLLRLADPPTAIFAFNDGMAIGVYHAASEAGRRIPDDLSVVGFDDFPPAQWLAPPMTTVHQPMRQMGEAAARMMVELARGATPEVTRLEVPTQLVVRASTAPPAVR